MDRDESTNESEMPTPTEADESRRGDSQHLPLQIDHDVRRLDELRGQIHGELAALRRRTSDDEWASSTKLFERAATNEWPLAY